MMDDLISNPLTSLLVTLCAFYAFTQLQHRVGGHAALNPVIWAIMACVVFIKLTGISYDTYMGGAGIIHFLLGPVTVALAVPLYRLLATIAKDKFALLITMGGASIISALSVYFAIQVMGGSDLMQLASVSKSVTAPIAIGIAEKLKTEPSFAVLFVFATNIPWLLFTGVFFRIIGTQSEEESGLALGSVCHGLGVARAFQISPLCGTYAVIGMSLMGIISGIALPIVFLYVV